MAKGEKPKKIDFNQVRATRASKLTPFIEDLRLARKNRWPLEEIKIWLKEEHDIVVSVSNLGSFCTRHGLVKGGENIESQTEKISVSKPRQRKTSAKTKKKFSFGKQEQEDFKKRVTGT